MSIDSWRSDIENMGNNTPSTTTHGRSTPTPTPRGLHNKHLDDPSTLASQQVGARLVIKSLANESDMDGYVVGDIAQVVGRYKNQGVDRAHILNERTGKIHDKAWERFSPTLFVADCACGVGTCRWCEKTFVSSKTASPREATGHDFGLEALHISHGDRAQKVGAILFVKWIPSSASNSHVPGYPMVGDLVKVTRFKNAGTVDAELLKTGDIVEVYWDSFFPAPYGEKCGCEGHRACRCIHETAEQLKTRFEYAANALQRADNSGKSSKSATDDTQSLRAADPFTQAGKKVGAVLIVKHYTYYTENFGPRLPVIVGVEVVSFPDGEWGKTEVKNLRTGAVGYVEWKTFYPVGPHDMCMCNYGGCMCEYENFEESLKNVKLREKAAAKSEVSTAPVMNDHQHQAADPTTPDGQRLGAVLTVKQHCWYPENFGDRLPAEIGDHIEILEFHDWGKTSGKNLRTGRMGNIHWKSFFKVDHYDMCTCDDYGRCLCVYKNFEMSLQYQKRREQKEL